MDENDRLTMDADIHTQTFRIKTHVLGVRLREEHIRHALWHYVNETAETDLTELERVEVKETNPVKKWLRTLF